MSKLEVHDVVQKDLSFSSFIIFGCYVNNDARHMTHPQTIPWSFFTNSLPHSIMLSIVKQGPLRNTFYFLFPNHIPFTPFSKLWHHNKLIGLLVFYVFFLYILICILITTSGFKNDFNLFVKIFILLRKGFEIIVSIFYSWKQTISLLKS